MNALFAHFRSEGRRVPWLKLCRWLGVARSTLYYQSHPRQRDEAVDESLASRIKEIIEERPAFGVRRVHVQLTKARGLTVNLKKVRRIMRLRRWTMHQRPAGRRPRAEKRKSIAATPNERWATDLACVPCGTDGYAVFAPVIDCCTREVLGWELARTGRASTAARALEDALLARFGTLRGAPPGLKLRHDNGLIFGSRQYVALAREYGLAQEYIAPHTPEQNGLCERFIRTLKEECVWLHTFTSITHAREHIAAFITYYNTQRYHQALNYTTPCQHHQNLCRQTA